MRLGRRRPAAHSRLGAHGGLRERHLLRGPARRLGFIPESVGVGMTRQRTIAVNPNTYAATRPGVFAAGDVTSGTAFVIEAVAAGHKAGPEHRQVPAGQGDGA